MTTHFLPFDANATKRQPRYARCGVMTTEDHHAAVPTCLACQRLLAEDDADMLTCPMCGYFAESGRKSRECPECGHVWEML